MTDGLPAPDTAKGRRERALTTTFVRLADTLVDDYDVVDLLDQLVKACVEILGVTAAGLLLADPTGNLAVVASSSEETRLLEVFQLQNNEGPCLDCVRENSPISSRDLRADHKRWPGFVPAAMAVGFAAVTALPLRLREQTIGGLNLFDVHPNSMSPDDQQLAQAFADVATIGILQQRNMRRSNILAEQLQVALNSRVVIEQAKGVIAERFSIGMDEAFATLRRLARSNNFKLTDFALAVVRGETLTQPLQPPPNAE